MALTKVQKEGIETLINNNADNRVITGSGTANTLNGESNVVIDSSGNLGIGAGTPRQKLHISASDSSSANMVFTNSTTGTSAGDGFIVGITGGEDAQLNMQESANLKFSTADTERMRIDSAGRVLINTSAQSTGTNSANAILTVNSQSGNTVSAAILALRRGQASASIAQNHTLGRIVFCDSQAGEYAFIEGEADLGSNGVGDTAGRIAFSTSADGSSAPTERMRIDSSGNVSIGSTSNVAPLNVRAMTDGNLHIRPITSIHSGTGVGLDVLNNANSTVKDLAIRAATTVFRNASGESMRIGSDGFVGIGVTSEVTTGGGACFSPKDASRQVLFLGCDTSGTKTLIQFQTSQGSAGAIKTSGSTTSYNTSSDYRLKENVTSISDGITRLKTLKPYRFNFKADASTTVDGFLAHEVTAVPEAVTGAKDEVVTQAMIDSKEYAEGTLNDPIYQGIDQSKLVPLLTAALQEEISKRESLETRVAALEAA